MNRNYENDNDISRVFAQKVDRQFRKDFAKYLPPSQRSDESKTKSIFFFDFILSDFFF